MNYFNYYTEIEEHFVRRRGKHLQLSPLDWSLIQTWKQSGIPMNVALRGIDIAMDTWHAGPRRQTERLGTLYYCHDAVMKEYAHYLESQVGASKEETDGEAMPATRRDESGPSKADVLRFLGARLAEIKALLAKQDNGETAQIPERICARLEEITAELQEAETADFEALDRDLGILDELLVSGLKRMVPQEESCKWDQQARQELKIYKKQLPKETYQRIVENFIRGKIHRLFHIGEFSLFHL